MTRKSKVNHEESPQVNKNIQVLEGCVKTEFSIYFRPHYFLPIKYNSNEFYQILDR